MIILARGHAECNPGGLSTGVGPGDFSRCPFAYEQLGTVAIVLGRRSELRNKTRDDLQ
jgi:hypothetical protein